MRLRPVARPLLLLRQGFAGRTLQDTWGRPGMRASPRLAGLPEGRLERPGERRLIREEPQGRPLRGRRSDGHRMPVGLGPTDEVYVGIVRVTLPGALDAARPDLLAHREP